MFFSLSSPLDLLLLKYVVPSAIKLYVLDPKQQCFNSLNKTNNPLADLLGSNIEVKKDLPRRTFLSSEYPTELKVMSFADSFSLTSTVTVVPFAKAQAVNTCVFTSIYPTRDAR